MKTLQEQILAYRPENEQEERAQTEILRQWDKWGQQIFYRAEEGHFTVSSIILNTTMNQMLMVYHNIYQSLSWTGGHADGAENFLQKAADEAREETGVASLLPVCSEILSLDCLPVKAHIKNGEPVAPHVHYNVAYGFLASDQQPLQVKADENSAVCWVSLEHWQSQCQEPEMISVYAKIIRRIQAKMAEKQRLYQYLPDVLLPWYALNARQLPWRQDKDPYHIWLSEIMLQQTRVEAVKAYYQRFLEQLPDIAALAAATEDQLLKLWEGLGYYTRVRNLQKAAQMIMDEYNGVFPQQYKDILALPGIGDYTAGAIAAICFDQPTPAVDGNVLRVISRITENFSNILSPAVKKQITEQLAVVYPSGERAYTFNQSLMELGATICLPNGAPKCGNCPMQPRCQAFANQSWELLPQKEAKKKRRIELKTVFVLQCGSRRAVEKRPPTGLLATLWQYPNVAGHLDTQEALNQAERWGVKPVAITQVLHGKHIFTHIEWHMVCYYLQCDREDCRFVWANAEQLEQKIALPTAFRIFD